MLAVPSVLWLLFTEQPVGFGRDESVYFHAAEQHGRWFQQLLVDGEAD